MGLFLHIIRSVVIVCEWNSFAFNKNSELTVFKL